MAGSEEPIILDSPEAVLTTLTKEGKRRWMYPVLSKGRHYWQRLAVGWGLIAIFLLLPIVHIAGKPAVFLDLAKREFTFFGGTLYATDTILLMLVMMTLLMGVIFATALLGRVWCGWGCPQTVYMEFVYRPIERLFEGKESKRRRGDDADLTVSLFWRKAGKYMAFLVVSLILAHTFVAYFASWDQLLVWMTGPPAENWGFFLVMSLTTTLIMVDFAYFREQMCTIACPYARLQSVLMDRDSMIVSYDPNRGESRGTARLRKKQGEDAFGDCVDCGACVRTCPTGIDIREGLQMECIGCTQCIDACDDIMDKVKKPRGLIRYTSESTLEGNKPRVLRPRMVLYAMLLAILSTLFAVALFGREPVDVNITRVPGAPFTIMEADKVSNRLRFRVQNRTGQADTFKITALAPEGAVVTLMGEQTLSLDSEQMVHTEAWVVVPAKAFLGGSTNARFRVEAGAGEVFELDYRLLGPSSVAKGQGR